MESAKKKQSWDCLGASFEKPGFLEAKLWIAEELNDYATVSFITSLCKSECYFSITQTPLKSCLLYFEVLQLFTHNFSIHNSLIKAKQEKIVDLSKNFIEEIETEEQIREILQETDIRGRTVEHLIKSHPELLLKI